MRLRKYPIFVADKSIHILLVDDEPGFRELFRTELENGGMKVLTAGDGADAAEMAGLCRFDVVVTGLKMPGMDGRALLKGMRRASPSTSVVVISNGAAVQDAVECMKHGAFDFVDKPADVSELRHIVEKAADESRLCRVKERRAVLQSARRARRALEGWQ